jgi:cation diffusion facilitator family transporter
LKPRSIILIALIVSILLLIAKFTAYLFTQSNAILTDATESIVNVVASAFAFYSIYLTALPKDQNHPYGHGKVEFFSVFIEGFLIFLAGTFIVIKASYNIFYPQNIGHLLIGSYIIALTGIINGILGWYLQVQGKKINSLTLTADGKHLITDAITSFGLVLGLILIYFTHLNWVDSFISLIVGIFIIYSGYHLLRKAIGGLMDESDIEIVEEVIGLLNQNRKAEWIDVHNLRTQRYGASVHIDCHVTLPYYFDLTKVHEEVSLIDKLISNNATIDTEFFIHADPCLPQCCN